MGKSLAPDDWEDVKRLKHIFQNNTLIAKDYWQQLQDGVDSPSLNKEYLNTILNAEKDTDDYEDLKRFQTYLSYGTSAAGQPGFNKFGNIKKNLTTRQERGQIDLSSYPNLGFENKDILNKTRKDYDFFMRGKSGSEVGYTRGEEISTGILRGTTKVAQGLLETGALSYDLYNDNAEASALQWLEDEFPDLYNTGELDTFLGLAAEYGIQYGTGWAVANKIIQSIIKKKGKAYLNKKLKKDVKKSWKQRVLEIGAPAAISEPLVSTKDDMTLLQQFGVYDSFVVDDENLSPKEKALNILKQKTAFGVEGVPIVGGVGATIMKTPAAVKFVGGGALKVAGKIVSPIGDYVVTPAAKLITTEIPIKKYNINIGLPGALRVTNTALGKVAEFGGKNFEKVFGKMPAREDWKLYSYKSANNLPQYLATTLSKIKAGLTTSGIAGSEAKELIRGYNRTIDVVEKKMREALESMSTKMYDIAENHTAKGNDGSAWAHSAIQKDFKDFVLSAKEKGKFLVTSSILPQGTRAQAKIIRNLLSEIKKEVSAISNDINVDEVINNAFAKDADDYLSMSLKITKTGSAGVAKKARDAAVARMSYLLKQTTDYKNKSKQQIRTFAENRVEELLAIGSKDGKQYADILNDSYEELAKSGIAKTKQTVKTVEELFGKSKDVRERILDTSVELATYVARSRMYKDLHRIGMGKMFFNSADELAIGAKNISTPLLRIGDDIVIGKNTIRPGVKEDVLGPLAGKYTTPEIANAITRAALYTDSWLTSPIYKALMAQKGFAQIAATVYSPATQVRNVTSAALFAVANGHFGKGASLLDSIGTLSKDLFTKHGKFDNKLFMSKIDEYNRQGLAGSGLVIKELKVVAEALSAPSGRTGVYGRFKTTDDLIDFLAKSKVFQKGKEVSDIAQKLYQFGDDVWKIFGYEFELGNKNKAFKIFNSKTGNIDVRASFREMIKYHEEVLGRKFDIRGFLNKNGIKNVDNLTEEMLDLGLQDIAGDVIRNTYPNYNYVPNLVQNWRRVPLGNFISFQTEMMRTSFNLNKFALREFQSSNKNIREDGAKRLIGFGIAAGGLDYGIGKAFQYIFAGDPETNEFGLNTVKEDQEGNRISGTTPEEKMEAMQRSFAPSWNKTGKLSFVGAELNEKIRPQYRYFNMAYQSPYTSTITAPFYVGINTFNDKRMEGKTRKKAMMDASFKAFGTTLSPFTSESIFGQRLVDVTLRGGKTVSGSSVWREEEDDGDKLVKGIYHLAGAYNPGAIKQVTKLGKAAYNFVTKEDRDKFYSGGKKTGKEYSLADEAISNFAGFRIYDLDVYDSLKSWEMYNYTKRRQNTNGIFYDEAVSKEASPKEIADAFFEHQIRNYRISTEFYTVLKDANTLGVKKKDMFPLFQGRSTLTQNDPAFLFQKKYWARRVPSFGPKTSFFEKAQEFGVKLNEVIPIAKMYDIQNSFNGIPLGLPEKLVREIAQMGGYKNYQERQKQIKKGAISEQQSSVQPTLQNQVVQPVAQMASNQMAVSPVAAPTNVAAKTTRQKIIEDDDFLKGLG